LSARDRDGTPLVRLYSELLQRPSSYSVNAALPHQVREEVRKQVHRLTSHGSRNVVIQGVRGLTSALLLNRGR